MAQYTTQKKKKTKVVPKNMPKRLDNPNNNYQRITNNKLGKQTMQYIAKSDFEKMQRAQMIRIQKAKSEGAIYRQERNYVMLMLGVNIGCRTNTICELTPRNVAGGRFYVKEHKTGKVYQFELRDNIKKLLDEYIKKYGFVTDEYMFKGNLNYPNKPISRITAWRFVKNLGKEAGVEYEVGAYSLRKSFARWLYDETHDIFKVQRVLDHHSAMETARYICLAEDEVMKLRAQIEYGFE